MTKVPGRPDLTKKPAFDHWYYYQCTPSSETRGRRDAHDGGCEHFNHRGTNQPITETWRPQGNPCKNCGRRQRLNPGIVEEAPYYTNGSWGYPMLAIEKQAWVIKKCDQLNAERLSNDSYAWRVDEHKKSLLERKKRDIERKRNDLRVKMLEVERQLRGEEE